MPPVRYSFLPTTSSQIVSSAVISARVAGQGGHVGHAGVEIGGPDGVSDGLGLLPDGLVVLGILAVELVPGGIAALIDEIAGQVEVAWLFRSPGRA